MCKNYITISDVEKKSDLSFWAFINEKSQWLNQKCYRTIALAYGFSNLERPPAHYTFLCLLQLENPSKPETAEVVKTVKEYGVRPLVLTGDRPETAMKNAEEIGIDNCSGYYLDGKIRARMDLATIARHSDHISVYARLLPSQKGIHVMSLRQRNTYVAMVGDGANDTIALKVEDVGISFAENSSPFAKESQKFLSIT
jgi:Ca2+-transporting ATPase